MRNLSIYVLVVYVTYGYLFLSLLTAHIPQFGLYFTGLRDVWMILSLFILFFFNRGVELFLILYVFLIGLVGFLFSGYSSSPLVFAYGMRDIIFLMIVLFICIVKVEYLNSLYRPMLKFIYLVLLLCLVSVVLQYLKFSELHESIFAINEYYSAKGITTNVNGGLFGARLLAPLYSASLVATLLMPVFLFTKVPWLARLVAGFVVIFTVAKVIPVFLYYKIFNKRPVFFGILSFLLLIFVYQICRWVIETMPISIYTFHASSVLDRFNIFANLPTIGELKTPFPLGYNSVAGHVINGLDASLAPESLLISKFYDFGFWSLPIFIIIFYLYALTVKETRPFLVAFIFIQFFSSLSNHLVAVVPFIIILRVSKSYTEGKRIEYRNHNSG